MANKGIQIWVRIIIAPIFLILTLNANGQNISKHYTSSIQSNGMLYFILPQSGFKNNKVNSTFIYDITYLTTNDSVTLNFSYYDKSNRDIDSIMFMRDNSEITSNTEKIFVETKKKKWHYRYSTQILFTDLNNFYSKPDNPKIILYSGQEIVELYIKTKHWEKQSAIIRKILTLIKNDPYQVDNE